MKMAQLGKYQVSPNGRSDDLTRVYGIGPAIEKRLHEGGILTYAQLAALTPAEAAGVVGEMIGMSAARVMEQEWIEQARQLAQQARAGQYLGESPEPGDGWRYAVFSLELLLDDKNRVRKTRALHVQSQADLSWRGWDTARLEEFIAAQAGVAIAPVVAPDGVEHELQPPEAVELGAPNLAAASRALVGSFQLTGIYLDGKDAVHVPMLLEAHQPHQLSLELDLKELQVPENASLAYSIMIYAERLGAQVWQDILQVDGWLSVAERINLEIGGLELAPGVYRLAAVTDLKSSQDDPSWLFPMAFIEGGVIKVS